LSDIPKDDIIDIPTDILILFEGNFPDRFAKMLIWLRENGYVKF